MSFGRTLPRNESASAVTALPGGYSECEPPDPISNSEVKPLSADDSVGLPHVKVGHRQDLKWKTPDGIAVRGFFFCPSVRSQCWESRASSSKIPRISCSPLPDIPLQSRSGSRSPLSIGRSAAASRAMSPPASLIICAMLASNCSAFVSPWAAA